MRKLLLFVLTLVVAIAATVSMSAAGADDDGAGDAAQQEQGAAAVMLPATPPSADAQQPGAYGYRSSSEIAAEFGSGPVASSTSAAPGGEDDATVVVSATVLPVRTIVVDDLVVTQLHSNTNDLDPANSLYVVREDSPDGAERRLDADTWSQARELFARADKATGRVY